MQRNMVPDHFLMTTLLSSYPPFFLILFLFSSILNFHDLLGSFNIEGWMVRVTTAARLWQMMNRLF